MNLLSVEVIETTERSPYSMVRVYVNKIKEVRMKIKWSETIVTNREIG